MRLEVVVTALGLSVVGLAAAAEMNATARQYTDIPAEDLGAALKSLARNRNFQVLYRAELVSDVRTAGVSGDLTSDEALMHLLTGTGLTFRYLDDKTVTIVPALSAPAYATSSAAPATVADPARSSNPSPNADSGRNGLRGLFRLAQANQATTGAAAAVTAGTAGSEQASDKSFDQLEEVVVTARRREESLQSVPVAVTVLSGAEIRFKRIETAQDLQLYVPSMAAYAFSGIRDGTAYSIRGQSTTIGAAPGVAVYLNEVPMATSAASDSTGGGAGLYLDLENLQVLNGPQGTLFGRNTTGGAVLLQSKKPTNNFEGYVQAGFGDYSDQHYEGVLNAPLIDDKLLLRVAGSRQTRDGFTRNVLSGQDLDNRDNWATRVTLSFLPIDAFRNDLIYYATSSRSNGSGRVITQLRTVAIGAALPLTVSYSGFLGTPSIQQAFDAQQARGIRATANNTPTNESSDYWSLADIAKWDITEALALKNIAAYQSAAAITNEDVDGSAIPVTSTYRNSHTGTTSEELQLQGKALADKLDWTVGGFLEDSHPIGTQYLDATLFGDLPFPGFPLVELSTNGARQHSRAVYAQGTYDFGGLISALNGLKFTGGYRYTWDHEDDFNRATNPDGSCANPSLPDCTFAAAVKSSAPTWTLGLDYQIDPKTLVYVKRSNGYKGGGFNPGGLDPKYVAFKPEYVHDVEIGLKRDWMLDTVQLRTNVDAFHTDYIDIQKNVFAVVNGTFASVTQNVAAARIQGVEFEGTLVPLRGLELSANYSYLDAKYTRAYAGSNYDTTLPFYYTPQNKFSVSGTFHVPIGSERGDVALSANYALTSRLFTATDFEPGDYIPGYGLLNVRADWSGVMGGPLDLGFFVTNATDTRYQVSAIPLYQNLGVSSALYGEPRMFGVQLRYRWGPDTPSLF